MGAIRSFFLIFHYIVVIICNRQIPHICIFKTNYIFFQGGFNEENDPIYIGRAHHEDSYAVGKVVSLFLCLCHAA